MGIKTEPRDGCGRFAEGNPGGPGRPRRATERDYLRALSEACDLAAWREIVARAVADAKDGNAKAREWLASYLVGATGATAETLRALAVDEEAGIDGIRTAAMRARRSDEVLQCL